MDKLIRDGRVIRGYIGISGREIAPLHAQGGGIDQLQGIVVNDVAPEGPAAQAGIRANDVIISVNDKPAVSALETMDQVAEIRPGSEIPVVIMRDDKNHAAYRRPGISGNQLTGSPAGGLSISK
jgi:serine protease DegS